MIQEPAEPWSTRERMAVRMRVMVLEARLRRAVRDDDATLIGASAEAIRAAMDSHIEAWQEIEGLNARLAAQSAFPEDDSCCLVDDEPLFGEHNPPDPSQYLYHYTRVATLPKIRGSQALRFRALFEMNDPHEALDSLAFQTGLIGPAGSALKLTSEEAAEFEAVDWHRKINSDRRNVKIGAFSKDVTPDLADVDPAHAEHSVPPRLAAHRGYAHPRMWAQYADGGNGVCLVLNHDRLKAAVERAVDSAWAWGFGDVSYNAAEHQLSLGFFDARALLRQGAAAALLENFEESLLTKHADWAHEAEFRFFILDGTSDARLVPITPDVIEGLILGPTFDPTRHLRTVRAFANSFNILGRVRLLHWTRGRAELVRV